MSESPVGMPHQPLEPAEFPGLWVNAQPVVRSFIFGVVHHTHDAEDILQEVARSAFTSFDQYDPARPFVSWVMAITRRRVVDHFRRGKGAAGDTVPFDEQTLGALGAAHEALQDVAHARRRALSECMGRVHERGRRALELRYREARPVKDIAAAFDTTPHAISVLLYKMKALLAECIDAKVAAAEAAEPGRGMDPGFGRGEVAR